MTATAYNLCTDSELQQVLDGCRAELEVLAPYNGTGPGARHIAERRRQMDLVQAEIDRRAANAAHDLCGSKHAKFDLTCTSDQDHMPGLHHSDLYGVWWE